MRPEVQMSLLVVGVVGPVYYFVLLTVFGILWTGYDPIRDSMSKLGAVDSPYRVTMNVFGFMGIGVVVLLFALPF